MNLKHLLLPALIAGVCSSSLADTTYTFKAHFKSNYFWTNGEASGYFTFSDIPDESLYSGYVTYRLLAAEVSFGGVEPSLTYTFTGAHTPGHWADIGIVQNDANVPYSYPYADIFSAGTGNVSGKIISHPGYGQLAPGGIGFTFMAFDDKAFTGDGLPGDDPGQLVGSGFRIKRLDVAYRVAGTNYGYADAGEIYEFTKSVSSVPEPTVTALFALGVLSIALMRRV